MTALRKLILVLTILPPYFFPSLVPAETLPISGQLTAFGQKGDLFPAFSYFRFYAKRSGKDPLCFSSFSMFSSLGRV